MYLERPRTLKFWASALVVLPVFLQAPWVHFYPLSALLFTFVLLITGVFLRQVIAGRWTVVGSFVVGVAGSWLGGCLFWGWLRSYPILHLPVEAIALPCACIGLGTKWKIGSAFYLSSLLGTALTDLVMALSGVIQEWPRVVNAPINEAGLILSQAASRLWTPYSMILLTGTAFLIIFISDQMHRRGNINTNSGQAWLVASAALSTTLWVDGLFVLTTLFQPKLSGLI